MAAQFGVGDSVLVTVQLYFSDVPIGHSYARMEGLAWTEYEAHHALAAEHTRRKGSETAPGEALSLSAA